MLEARVGGSVPIPHAQGPLLVCAEPINTTANEEPEICQTNSFLPIPQGIRTE